MSKINTVLITGVYGTENLGDDKILSGLATLCRTHYDADEIIAASIDPDSTRKISSVDRSIPTIERGLSEWMATVKTVDLIVLGGGTVVSTPIARRHGTIATIAKMLGIKTYVIAGVGYGDWIDRKISKYYLRLVDGIAVRDSESKQQLQNMGVDDPIDVVPDPGFIDEQESSPVPEQFPENYILISIRPVKHGKSIPGVDVVGLAAGLDTINRKHPHQLIFLPFHRATGSDIEFSKDVENEMETKAMIANEEYTIAEYESTISNAESVVGMRLHSMILAAHQRTPFVPITYAPKCRLFLEHINVNKYLTHDRIESVELTSMVENSLNKRTPINEVESRITELENESQTLFSKCDQQGRHPQIGATMPLMLLLSLAFIDMIIDRIR